MSFTDGPSRAIRSSCRARRCVSTICGRSRWPSHRAPRTDGWALAPRGEIRRLTLELDRPRAGAIPVFAVDADVANLGAAASGVWPGLEGLTATVKGSDERGRIELRSPSLDFEWPRMFSAAPGPIAVTGEVEWRREGRTWIAAAKKVSLEHAQGRAHGAFEFRYAGRRKSPELRVDGTVERADAALVRTLASLRAA